jgi:hypothetical protein
MVNDLHVLDEQELATFWTGSGLKLSGNGELAALWLPCAGEDEPLMFEELSGAWRQFNWWAMGSWFATKTNPDPAKSFSERYPEVAVKSVISNCTMSIPGGRRIWAEWCSVELGAHQLYAQIRQLRTSHGKGKCLSIAPLGAIVERWYTSSMMMFYRAVMAASGGRYISDFDAMDREIIARYLTGSLEGGFACVIPLNIHPWGGCVVVASGQVLLTLKTALPNTPQGLAHVSWEEVRSRAGGISV